MGGGVARSRAPSTSQRMRTRPVRMRSQEAFKLTGMGSLTDIALALILRVFGWPLDNCEGQRRGLATGTLVLEAVFIGQLSVVRKSVRLRLWICSYASL